MLQEKITELLSESIPEAEIMLKDLTGESNHFEVIVLSQAFAGKSRMERHRMVMAPLEGLLKAGTLHALTIKTYTETEGGL